MRAARHRLGKCVGIAAEAESVQFVCLFCWNEFLNSFSIFHFARVDVSLGVHRNGIDPVELSRVTSVATEGTYQSAVVAIENPDHVVRAVRDQDVLLLRIS